MSRFLDAFWRALAYCLHPRVIVLSFLPLVIAGGLTVGLGYFFWEPAVLGVRDALDSWVIVDALLSWLEAIGVHGLRLYLAPVIVITLQVPVIVLFALVLVALFATPALVKLVAARRFPLLERRQGGSLWQSAMWSIGCTLLALLALVVSIPLWFIPPLVLLVPPLIWGWLTYRVMSFDVLAEHASKGERKQLLAEHRWPLLAMGVIAGYLGAAPSLLWAFGGLMFIPLAPVLVVVAIWLYTLVFAFSALWFAHYTLSALQQMRQGEPPASPMVLEAEPAPALPAPPIHPDAGLTALRRIDGLDFSNQGHPMDFGLIVIGDEILSGKRVDKHLPKLIELLAARGLSLSWARHVGDDPERITRDLRDAFVSGDVVFSCGGIGATPDDHTRQCAAAALQRPLILHPEARELILERMRDVAAESNLPYEPERSDNQHRLNMGVFPEGASLIPNPYNKIAGFTVDHVHFVPGFPVMAWPMMEWVLDTHYAHLHQQQSKIEQSVIVFGAMEAALTPLMEAIEAKFAGVKVFSLPSVDHPQYGRHIELGVKGEAALVAQAYPELLRGLTAAGAQLSPELVR